MRCLLDNSLLSVQSLFMLHHDAAARRNTHYALHLSMLESFWQQRSSANGHISCVARVAIVALGPCREEGDEGEVRVVAAAGLLWPPLIERAC